MRPSLTRSPTYVLTLVAGSIVTLAGWATVILFERTIVTLTAELQTHLRVLPEWMAAAPAGITRGGVVAALVLVNFWLIESRRFRRLLLADVAFLVGVAVSAGAGTLVLAGVSPSTRAIFDALPDQLIGSSPTDPAFAGAIAVLAMVRQWLPSRVRPASFAVAALVLVTHLMVEGGPPYLGIVLDVGLGMTAGSLVALALRTPNLQPDRDAIARGLAASGIEVAELRSANVDARGSEPWIGSTIEGDSLFVKALSPDQRAADLLFRAMRWLRLRRTGDAPPEVSLRRAAEHEALVSHHARSLGIATPRMLAVATVGPRRVALAYEGKIGRSVDKVPLDSLTDERILAIWELVGLLRRHRIAHRDLRLANIFLTDDGEILLIDFGFAELAASQQLLDTDLAELLAATGAVVGEARAARLAVQALGPDTLEQARDWLHPLAFSTATREALSASGGLEALRVEVNRLTGHSVTEYQPLGRLSPSHLVSLGLGAVGVYSLLALVAHDGIARRVSDIGWWYLAAAVAIGLLVPALNALAYRSAMGRRDPIRPLLRAAYAAETPVVAPTSWSFTNRVLSDAAREIGVEEHTAKRAASDRTRAGLLSAPLMVAGFAAAGLPAIHGHTVGIALGFAAGALVALGTLAIAALTPSGRELARVWIRPFRSLPTSNRFLARTAVWSALIATAQGGAFALAARAAGVQTRAEVLIALGVATLAIASLLPAPGALGAFELLGSAGLLLGNSVALAVLGAVLAGIALFWVPLPIALWTYRSTRFHRMALRRAELDEPRSRAREAGGAADQAVSAARSWWS